MKKIFLFASIGIIIFVVYSFTTNKEYKANEGYSRVKWYTFEEAVNAQKLNHKLIMVDVYTSWCGPCKMMSAYTFENPVIANYLNEHFYPVKFNAETRDSVKFNGYYFVNSNPPENKRPVHDFAASILDNKLMYPSIVFIDKNIQRLQIINGYLDAQQFEPVINFFGSGKYSNTAYEEFMKTFKSDLKAVK